MSDLIRDVEVFSPMKRVENPAYDANFILKWSGYVTVRIVMESGLDGWGMTFSDPVAEYVARYMKDELIGKDPIAHEDIWAAMYGVIRSSGRKGVALMAMSAVDIAIWDLRGKLLGLPIYRLLGGTNRRIPAYASVGFLSMPDDEVVEKSLQYIQAGYTTLKIKVGFDRGNNIKADVKRVEKVRAAVGNQAQIIVDANGVYDAATAIRFARAAADVDICLLEEPTHADDIAGLRRVRDTGLVPVASGENEYTKYGCRDLLMAEAVDVLQFDIARTGGFTEMMKIAAISQAWNVKMAPHFWPQFSAHVLSAIPNGLYLEVFPENRGAPIIKNQPAVTGGFYEIPDAPGLGLDFDREYLLPHTFTL